ncbi:MAG: hypothetical protein WBS22_06055, partial [Methylocystis sp.]
TSSYTGKHSEPKRLPDGSGVNREVHAPFCERPEVKFLRPTHPSFVLLIFFLLMWVLVASRILVI